MRTLRIAVLLALGLCLLAAVAPAQAEGFKGLEGRVVEKTLANGLKVIILPQPGAPVISMVTYADVGAVDENQNGTGLAHIFEHMAFKGTTTIGTKDYEKEKIALQKVDAAFLALRAERLRRPKPDPEKLKTLEAALKSAQEEAQQYVIPNELGDILERAGAMGLNAFTSPDQTCYHYSLPSNKLELWAALEYDRFTNPVLREFYKEKDVIMEEKRMGENQPPRRLLDDFFAVAYKASMYRDLVIGHMSDLMGISKADAEAWFNKYYRARNLTAVIVGDVDPAKAMPILEKYLGKIPAGEKPGPVITQEPAQRAEKRIIMEDQSQPILFIAYHRPDINDPDQAVYDAIADILGGGRSARLYKTLVKEQKLALATGSIPGFGQKYPGLFVFFAVANQGKTNAENEDAIYKELERIKSEPVTAEELLGVKARTKAKFIESLDSNMGLALGLAFAQNLQGDWRETFKQLEAIDRVTAADIQRVARQTFVRANRTVGMIENVPAQTN